VNATGTQMSFTKAAITDINASWLGGADRRIVVRSAGDQYRATPAITAGQ
jgi:hypothetical protein